MSIYERVSDSVGISIRPLRPGHSWNPPYMIHIYGRFVWCISYEIHYDNITTFRTYQLELQLIYNGSKMLFTVQSFRLTEDEWILWFSNVEFKCWSFCYIISRPFWGCFSKCRCLLQYSCLLAMRNLTLSWFFWKIRYIWWRLRGNLGNFCILGSHYCEITHDLYWIIGVIQGEG